MLSGCLRFAWGHAVVKLEVKSFDAERKAQERRFADMGEVWPKPPQEMGRGPSLDSVIRLGWEVEGTPGGGSGRSKMERKGVGTIFSE